jgi:hypothetical protein
VVIFHACSISYGSLDVVPKVELIQKPLFWKLLTRQPQLSGRQR